MLRIEDLSAEIDGSPILKGFSLQVPKGEIHAIMGPNGAGKSTLAKVLAGHPAYQVTSGSVEFLGRNLLDLEPEERAHLGLFMSFQYPVEIPGVGNVDFLHMAHTAKQKAHGRPPMSREEFVTFLKEKMAALQIPPSFLERNVNEGFSGGEKKRNEILQMAVLEPHLAILDETDSGLDIDALRVVAEGVRKLKNPERSILAITHYQRLLDHLKPDVVHVMVDGIIVQSGGPSLAHQLEEKGYECLQH